MRLESKGSDLTAGRGFEVMPYSLTKDQVFSRQPASAIAPLHAQPIKRGFKAELCTVYLGLGNIPGCLNQDYTLLPLSSASPSELLYVSCTYSDYPLIVVACKMHPASSTMEKETGFAMVTLYNAHARRAKETPTTQQFSRMAQMRYDAP